MNQERIPDSLFVTGTDTGVGKTVLSAALCTGLKAGYWKPVQAGRDPMTDTERVRNLTALPQNHFYPETYILDLPMSPHAAAEAEGREIDPQRFELPESSQKHLIVEGAGGLLVPLNREVTMLDLIADLDIPVLLVARSGLGTINHTLMSLKLMEAAGILLWGVVLNGRRHASNEDAIRHFGRVERLFSFPHLKSVDSKHLFRQFHKSFSAYAS